MQTPIPLGQRPAFLLFLVILLLALMVASIRFGSNSLTGQEVWQELTQPTGGPATAIIWEQRLPRTLLACLCGAALALAGALMQTLTRNPLAEPGLLGINAGASLAVIGAVVLWGVLPLGAYMGLGMLGAALACLAVLALGRGPGSSPLKLALAGVALAAALSAFSQALLLSDQTAYNEFRFWSAGSLEARDLGILASASGPLILGLLLALGLGNPLRTLAVGEEAATGLGANLPVLYGLTLLAVTLLAGVSTAVMGPITFLGLAVPFLLRPLTGQQLPWLLVLSLLGGPIWLLASDLLARTLLAPIELQVGIVSTLLGGPLFLALMSRRQVKSL